MNRKQILMGALLVPAALSVTAATSRAQEKERPYGVRLGVAALTGGDERDAFGETGKLGLSYDFKLKGTQKIQPRADFDYARFSDNGARLTSYGLSANVEIPLAKTPNRGPYALVGLGVFRVAVRTPFVGGPTTPPPITPPVIPPVIPPNTGGSGGSGGQQALTAGSQALVAANLNDSSTKLGANLGIGYKFSETFSGELTYTLLGRVAGVRADHAALSLGFSF